MLHTQLAALALAVAAVTASGCGSSKTGSTTTAAETTASTASTASVNTTPATIATGAPLSRARWIAEGDAICATTNDKFATLGARNNTQFLRALPQAAIYYTSESEDLSKLVAPKSMTHDWEQIVDDIHLTGEYANAVAQDIKANQQQSGVQLLRKAEELRKDTLHIAKRDGFKWCSLGRPPRPGE
jgi:hypothetical protein